MLLDNIYPSDTIMPISRSGAPETIATAGCSIEMDNCTNHPNDGDPGCPSRRGFGTMPVNR